MFKITKFSLLFLLFVLIFFILIFLGIVFVKNLKPVSNDATQIVLEIPEGASFNEIISQLKEKGLIRQETVFKIFAILSGKAHQLKPGKYFLSKNLSAKEIINELTAGPKEVSITIIPGRTLKEIDEILAENKIIKKGELIDLDVKEIFSVNPNKYFFLEGAKSLEGFLLPDTYYFLPGESVQSVVLKMVDNFSRKALPILKQDGKLSTDRNFIYKTLILASFLEKEVPVFEDQKIAAGVLEKRLTKGMPLQVDATILYAKCEGRFINCPALTKEDFKINSVYNTYLFKGLTPTPISNPSISTIEAAANPVSSSFFYYLSTPKSTTTIFSKTLEEHNRYRFQYLLNN